MSKEETLYIKGMDNLDGDLTLPSFMIWLRKNRNLSQRELAIILDIPYAQVTHIEKSRQVLPYKTLRKLYQEVLTKAEREYFLTCMKGHIQLLMEATSDDEFRAKVKTPHLVKNAQKQS